MSVRGITLPLLLVFGCPVAAEEGYEKDMEFAVKAIAKECAGFIKSKKIDWKSVSSQFTEEAKKVSSDKEHLILLTRLLARLNDGHAYVRPLEKGKGVEWKLPETTGPGMFWCRVGNKIYVKNSWSAAKAAGVVPGMEVVKVNDEPAADWLKARIAKRRDLYSFSTDHQAFFYECHWGLKDPAGTEIGMEVRTPRGRRKKIDFNYTRAIPTPWGPAFFPKGLERTKDLNFGKTEDGWGYVHVRRCKGDVNEQMDKALAAVGNVPGLILDFRGNSGGGFDHDAFMGRFVPEGKTMVFRGTKRYASAGPAQYGGPIVVIVDATVRSAGETAAGIFKEDGRAYMIGESPTAGMSSSKKAIELPSGLFALYVSVYSNKARFQDGKGIEGIGVRPHETVAFDSKDLAEERDTLIIKAEELLKRFPQNKVPYDPKKFGWKKGG